MERLRALLASAATQRSLSEHVCIYTYTHTYIYTHTQMERLRALLASAATQRSLSEQERIRLTALDQDNKALQEKLRLVEEQARTVAHELTEARRERDAALLEKSKAEQVG
jgi:hypothetical protein